MTTLARSSIAALACLLALTGCGGPPEDASTKTFCAQLTKAGDQKSWKDAKSAVLKLKDVGTPSDIPDAARDGFVELVAASEQAESREQLTEAVEDLGKKERADLDALESYVTQTCGD